MSSKYIYSTEFFIKRAKEIHGDKYDYSKSTYINSTTHVCITCKDHGEFFQSPSNHLLGKNCPTCARIIVSTKRNKSTEQFIHQSILIHGDKYDYSQTVYSLAKTNVQIICKHHDAAFLQTPDNHLQGKGCPLCAAQTRGMKRRNDPYKIIDKMNTLYNHKYDYSYVAQDYNGILSPLRIRCPEHGIFITSFTSHYRKHAGCPACSTKYSLKSQQWLDSLNITTLIREYTLPQYARRKVDGYDPLTNTIYQFHGSYWHSDPRTCDGICIHPHKNIPHNINFIKSNKMDDQLIVLGYNLVIMWEFDWDNPVK